MKNKSLKNRLYPIIYGDICAAVYCFNCSLGLSNSIPQINESKDLNWWAKNCTKKVMEEYESAVQ